ncbi:MAG: hypothetical protein ACI959_001648 [Limisphaerales bacterium]|jgi:hypothetical protein
MSKWASKTVELIRSLNRSEQRYVRLTLVHRPENREPAWLDLFDYLVKHLGKTQTHPEPTKIIAALPSMGSKKKLSHTSGLLRAQVLNALRDYYASSIPENQLLRKIEDIGILLRKGQFELADQILKSAWKEAEELSWNPYWHKLAQFESFLARTRAGFEELHLSLNALEIANSAKSELLSDTLELNILANKMHSWIARDSGGAEEGTGELIALSAHRLLQEFPQSESLKTGALKLGSLEGQMRYHEIRGTIAFHQNDFALSVKERSALVKLFSDHEQRITREPIRYIVMLNNLIISAMRMDNYEEVQKWLNTMRRFPENYKLTNKENIAATAFSNSYSNEIYYLLNRKRYDRLQVIIPEIRKGLDRFSNRLSNEYIIDFDYQISRAWFEMEQYNNCLSSLQPILNDWPVGFRTAQQVHGQILNFLTHFQLGNFRVLETALLRFRRFSNQAKHKSKITNALLKCLKKINYLPESEKVRLYIGNFRQNIEEDMLNSNDELFLLESGITAWLSTWKKA